MVPSVKLYHYGLSITVLPYYCLVNEILKNNPANSAGLQSLREADVVTRAVLGVLKREIGVEISEQVEKVLAPDLQKGWQNVEIIGSKDLRDSIK